MNGEDDDDDDDSVVMECEIFIDRVGRDTNSDPEPDPEPEPEPEPDHGSTLSCSNYPENRSRIAVTSRWMEDGEIDEEDSDIGVLVKIRVDQGVMSRVDGITGRTVSDLRNVLGDVVMERIMCEIRVRIADMDNTVRGTIIIVVKEGAGVSENDVDNGTVGRTEEPGGTLVDVDGAIEVEEEEVVDWDEDYMHGVD